MAHQCIAPPSYPNARRIPAVQADGRFSCIAEEPCRIGRLSRQPCTGHSSRTCPCAAHVELGFGYVQEDWSPAECSEFSLCPFAMSMIMHRLIESMQDLTSRQTTATPTKTSHPYIDHDLIQSDGHYSNVLCSIRDLELRGMDSRVASASRVSYVLYLHMNPAHSPS